MKLIFLFGLVKLSCLTAGLNIQARNYEQRDYYVLQLEPASSPFQVAEGLGLQHEGLLGELPHHHIFSTTKVSQDVVRDALRRRRQARSTGDHDVLDHIKFAQKQHLKPQLRKRDLHEVVQPHNLARQEGVGDIVALARQAEIAQTLNITDPIFHEQWHLFNPVEVGHDVNVTDVWRQGITGHNATVAIVDDGLDMYSDDLKENYYAEGSYDFNDQTLEPRPRLDDDRHGTRCAGEVSAVKNDVCGVGVAWDSKIAGIRILSKVISDADEAVAMNYAYQHNQIYSCSWGPPDDGRSMDAPGILIKRAMLNAVQNGRGGKGSIYVFASGNGAANDDNCNFDGYTNSIYSITVGAVDRKGQHPYYSEECSAQLVVTYSSGSGDAIHTTDVGTNACYSGHGGTSAAAPLAAGIFALALSIRPDLTWRDMQYLVMETALPIDLDTGDWQTTTIGKKYSHTFGYGKIDSWATIEAAKTFKNVKPQSWFYSPWMHVHRAIPQGDVGLAATFEVSSQMLQEANLGRLEHVTVTMNVEHDRRGDLSVDLISPDGLISHLSVTRRLDDSNLGYADWTFMSVVHWGESGIGKWTIVVKDTQVNDHAGTFIDWHLKLWGESVDASKAKLLPLPDEHDDDNHDVTMTTSVTAEPTAIEAGSLLTTVPANPTDHPDRPVNAKPSSTEDQSARPTVTSSPSESTVSSWLSNIFPTFGSLGTQMWVYGSTVLIIIFCCALSIYLFRARRRRLSNNAREEYEFELVDEDEIEGLTEEGKNHRGPGRKAGGKPGRSRRRAGELYDAFAAGSEEDSEMESEYKDVEGEGAGGDVDSEGNRNSADEKVRKASE